ncbi:MAG: 2-phosphosulfolactate phosphatase [Chitinophagaceae bacterium]|nr:2-phosphosulfolactate phosphatase [Chitinophagaceae bacterium]
MSQKPPLFTVLSPALLHLYEPKDSIVVIIDVFRATSTIAAALYHGAKYVIPVDSVSKAIEISRKISGIAAGERDGKIAEGLHHGNSPLEYSSDFIKDKILVLTTTNGTRLLQMAVDQSAQVIISGSFPNLAAVCDFLASGQKKVLLSCAGWKDRVNLEDALFAGAVIHYIGKYFTIHCDSSLMAKVMYEKNKNDLLGFAPQMTHYHRLVERFGLIEDIRYCLSENVAPVLPVYREGRLVAERI